MSGKEQQGSPDEGPVSASSAGKMGVVRYCQIKEISSGIFRILKNRYGNEVHTENEWNDIVRSVLNRKVR